MNSKAKTSYRNPLIDLWKFIFAMVPIVRHGAVEGLFSASVQSKFNFCSLCVDFFLVISGWLLASSIAKINKKSEPSPLMGTETLGFIKRRFSGIFPYVVVAVLIAFFVEVLGNYKGVIEAVFTAGGCLNEVLLLQMTGIPIFPATGTAWYLSAMLIAIAIYYPLMRKHYDTVTAIVAPLVGLMGYGICRVNYNVVQGGSGFAYAHITIDGVLHSGLIWGIAGISLGIFGYRISMALSKVNLTKFSCIALSLLSEGAMVFTYLFMIFFGESALTVDYTCIMLLLFSLSFMFSGKDPLAKLLPVKITTMLAKYTVATYLCHYAWARFFAARVNTLEHATIYYLVTTFVMSGVCMFIVWMFKKIWPKIKKVFVAESVELSEQSSDESVKV